MENNNFSKAEEIKKLKELLDEGILTKEEFEIEKEKILNKEIQQNKLNKKFTHQKSKQNSKQEINKPAKIAMILVFILIPLLTFMSCQDSKTTKQNIAQSKNIEKTELNPDYDNFMKDLEKLLQSQSELIIGFEAMDNSVDYYHVTVSDLWFEASNIEKERYVNTFYKSLYYTLVKNEIISENTSIFIYFYDSYGIELAKPTMTGFKILK